MMACSKDGHIEHFAPPESRDTVDSHLDGLSGESPEIHLSVTGLLYLTK